MLLSALDDDDGGGWRMEDDDDHERLLLFSVHSSVHDILCFTFFSFYLLDTHIRLPLFCLAGKVHVSIHVLVAISCRLHERMA